MIRHLVLILLGFGVTSVYADAASSQQALEQLKQLQQRMSSTPEDGVKPAIAPITAVKPTVIVPDQTVKVKTVETTVQTTEPDTVLTTEEENALVDGKAFEDVSRQLFPLTPEQILRLKQMRETHEFAQAATAGTPPKPTATSQFVNLSPGSTPPVIRLAQGFVSSLVFLDSTGAPWPISAYDLGSPSAFNIQWDKTSNTLMIQAMKLYNYGNLAVRLRGLNTPVMLTLIPGQKAVDYRVDLRVQGYGPNAKNLPMEEGLPPSANDLLLHVLDGVPPIGSQRLVVSGGDARAWLSNEKMYVRTNLTVISPGWLASMTSADGTHAYEMQKSPILLVSWHGKVMQLKVEGL
jgi:intracellular multiplication protein IcmK